MSAHALLSPSSAHRWLNCPRAPRLEAQLPEKVSKYAEEGTVAHSVCEIIAKKHFGKIKTNAYFNKAIKKPQTNELWDDEMLRTAETYVEHLAERAMSFSTEPYTAFEVKVDISDYVPEAFGRCDCVMLGGDTLIITDYKHGKGVAVEAEKNPQMMLYALGALKLYKPLFGETLKNVWMYIDQPRINSYEGWSCTVEELLAWGEEIKPKADMAFAGFGEYHAGDWCRFCRANGICKAQAEQQISAFDDFKDAIENPESALLSPEEISDVLERGKNLVVWYDTVKENALSQILAGAKIPGWKAVEGRSIRVWSDQDKALEKLQANGIDRAAIYDSVPKTLAQLEKMIGKTKFRKLVDEFIVTPQGKPTLAAENDKRKEFNSAANDFAAVAEQ
ncbi:MAG: DUF2800 domain-containing protein [Ruminococcus sp.]|nr:DUF2800 domain-containing protein [Ruminococcus sp.]